MKTELVSIPTSPARSAELVSLIAAAREGYLAPPRCISVRILRAEEETSVVAVIDWISVEAHDEAAAGDDAAAFLAAIGPLASGPPEVGWYLDAP